MENNSDNDQNIEVKPQVNVEEKLKQKRKVTTKRVLQLVEARKACTEKRLQKRLENNVPVQEQHIPIIQPIIQPMVQPIKITKEKVQPKVIVSASSQLFDLIGISQQLKSLGLNIVPIAPIAPTAIAPIAQVKEKRLKPKKVIPIAQPTQQYQPTQPIQPYDKYFNMF
jgi:hypothetical protein